MAKKLRGSGTGSSDVTASPTGSGRNIYQDGGGSIEVWVPSAVEASDTIYVMSRKEPKASGTTYPASRHGD